MLATDMRMLSGEMKVDVMASLLSSMLARQSLMEGEMKIMREGRTRASPSTKACGPLQNGTARHT